VSSQLTLHPRVAPLNKVRSGLYVANFLTALGVDTLTTEIDEAPGWTEKLYDSALRLYPAGRERCASSVCRRIVFMYGEVYDHDQLNDATHEAMHEMFGMANLKTFKQIARAIRAGHIVTADGDDAYLPETDRLKVPIAFIHGENNRLFLPDGSRLTYEHLCEANGQDLYTRHVIEGYAHMDCFIGKNASVDVYPLVAAELDRHNPT
jgi:cholesterol oxidase